MSTRRIIATYAFVMFFLVIALLGTVTAAFGGARIDTLVAKIEEGGRRSFKILRMKPDGKSYAKDIADKYGLSFEKITETIEYDCILMLFF